MFLPYHLKTFKWAMVANQNFLKIITEPLHTKKKGLVFTFSRKKAKAIVTSFSDSAKEVSLLLKKGEPILRAIDRNADLKRKIFQRREELKARLKGSEIFYKSLNLIKKPFKAFKQWFGKKPSKEDVGNVLENITDHYFVLKKTAQMADNLALKYSLDDYNMSLKIIEKRICYYFELFLKEKRIKNYFNMGPIRKMRVVGKRTRLLKKCQ